MSKLTKEQLHGMSDFEVNKELCTLLGKDVSGICELRNQMTGAVVDCCNRPNDIMPLAFEHRIGLQPARNEWQAFAATADFYNDEKPLRAIACCLILVLQGGGNDSRRICYNIFWLRNAGNLSRFSLCNRYD